MTDARPFHFKHFSLFHHRSSMKVGTDAIMLGRWTDVKPSDVVLDIGTGCGLLPLMLAQKGVAQVDAVDIDSASIEEATINFEASQWREQLKAFCVDIVDFQTDKQYDLIITNPPYFVHFSQCDSTRKSKARHSDVTLSFDVLCGVVRRFLKPDGRFALVLPAVESVAFLKVAQSMGLFLHKRMAIIPIAGKESNRVHLELAFLQTNEIQEETFVLRDGDNRFTAQYKDFLKDFYLG